MLTARSDGERCTVNGLPERANRQASCAKGLRAEQSLEGQFRMALEILRLD